MSNAARTLVCSILILAGSCQKQGPEPLVIGLIGDEHRWFVIYPGEDQRLGTADDIRGMRHIFLPADSEVRILLDSSDYIYSFKVDHFGISQLIAPAIEFEVRFETGPPANHQLDGGQMCGLPRFDELDGQLIVLKQSGFDDQMAQLRRQPPLQTPTDPSAFERLMNRIY